MAAYSRMFSKMAALYRLCVADLQSLLGASECCLQPEHLARTVLVTMAEHNPGFTSEK